MPIGVLLRRRQLTIILLLLASLSSLSILTVPSVFPPEANHPYTSLPPVTKLDRLYQRWSSTHPLLFQPHTDVLTGDRHVLEMQMRELPPLPHAHRIHDPVATVDPDLVTETGGLVQEAKQQHLA